MEFLPVLIIAALVFGVCFLLDKGFTKLFRGKAEHRSGKAVRMSSRAAAFGLILALIGLAAIFVGLQNSWIYIAGGAVLILVGAVLVVQYMTFGIFYDDESFVLTTFGKRSTTYCYEDICCQQLYNSQGSIVVELHMNDGRTVMLQGKMKNAYAFLDHAFSAWLTQTGRTKEDCSFYDPDNSCWFPPVEVQ